MPVVPFAAGLIIGGAMIYLLKKNKKQKRTKEKKGEDSE